MIVNICGIPYKVVEAEDYFDVDAHFGQIDYKRALILINSGLTSEIKNESLCHEIVHGILVHLGYSEKAQDEQFVQALGNAINQCFTIKVIDNERN